MSEREEQKIIWIVGASTGIGLALAQAYAAQSCHVIISARRRSMLEQVKLELLRDYPHCIVTVIELDTSEPSSVSLAYKRIMDEVGMVDSVIINAGTCEYIDSIRIDTDRVRRVMETNFLGAINVVNASLPLLRAAKANAHSQPQLVFVSSSVTYQALPRAGAYGASKAALRYFAESLKLDLQHEGIDVRVVSPGFVKTPLTDQNDFAMPARISATTAAQRIVKGLQGNRFDVNFPKRFTWALKLISLLPTGIKHKLLGKTSRHLDDLNESSDLKHMKHTSKGYE